MEDVSIVAAIGIVSIAAMVIAYIWAVIRSERYQNEPARRRRN